MTALTDVRPAADHFRAGLVFALSSAFAFGLSGPLGKSLMEAGWSPTAAVTARLAGGALAMAVFATVMNRNWVREALAHWKTVVAYGVVPIAGAQLCYYNAVSHLSVGVALLIEYTAPVLVVGWLWATTRRRPTNLTLAGVVLAVAGIMLVLDVFSDAHVNLVGVGWALVAAVCAACYFMMSDEVSTDPTEEGALNPITLRRRGLDRRRSRRRPARSVTRDADDLHRERRRCRGIHDVVDRARRRDGVDPHRDRVHAGHHGRHPPAAAVCLAGRPLRSDVCRARRMGATRRSAGPHSGRRRGSGSRGVGAGPPG